MKSITQFVVKLVYMESICNILMQLEETEEAHATIVWMKTQSEEITDKLLVDSGQPHRLAVEADKVKKFLNLKNSQYDPPGAEGLSPPEVIYYVLCILTQMLEDMREVPNKAHYIEDLSTGAYTLEEILTLPKKYVDNTDTIRGYANAYLQAFYNQLSRY